MTKEEEKTYQVAYSYVYKDMPKFDKEVNRERLKCFTDGYEKAKEQFNNELDEIKSAARELIAFCRIHGSIDEQEGVQIMYDLNDLVKN